MTRTPDVDRNRRSRDKLRASGGVVTSIRLSPEAEAAVQAIIRAGLAANRRAAIEWALMEAKRNSIAVRDAL
jgi:hypothetical protein